MTGEQDGSAGDRDDVGSLGEEAAKLFGALSDWAREQPAEGPAADRRTPGDRLAEALHQVDEHVATGAPECRWCPVCRVVHAVRQTSPEVREHLVSAAGSLLEAAAGVLATQVPRDQGSRGAADRVERIDLDGDDGEDWPDDAPDDRAADGAADGADDGSGR